MDYLVEQSDTVHVMFKLFGDSRGSQQRWVGPRSAGRYPPV